MRRQSPEIRLGWVLAPVRRRLYRQTRVKGDKLSVYVCTCCTRIPNGCWSKAWGQASPFFATHMQITVEIFCGKALILPRGTNSSTRNDFKIQNKRIPTKISTVIWISFKTPASPSPRLASAVEVSLISLLPGYGQYVGKHFGAEHPPWWDALVDYHGL